MYIADELQQKGITIDQNRLEPTAKQLPVETMGFVEALCVNPVDVAHAAGKIPSGGVKQQMVMVGHQAIGSYSDLPQPGGFFEQRQKTVIVRVIFEHPLVPTPAVHHMMPCAGKFYA